jgi:hypothetical protein
MKNALAQNFLRELETTEDELRKILETCGPADCREAHILLEWAKQSLTMVNALEIELDAYEQHAKNCKL